MTDSAMSTPPDDRAADRAPQAPSRDAMAPAVIGSAEQLIAAREARGWSVTDVAAKLGMMPRQIEAIEQARWDALPGRAFVRGAIRAYGKALQLDVAPLLASLASQVAAPVLRSSSTLDAALPKRGALGFDSGGSGSRLTWILLAVLGVIAIALYFGRGGELARVLEGGPPVSSPGHNVESVPVTPPKAPGAPDAAPADSSAAPDSQGPLALAVAAPAAAAPSGAGPAGTVIAERVSSTGGPTLAVPVIARASAGEVAPDGAAASVPGSDDSAAAPDASSAATPADSLQFRFEGDSWVDVRDAGGKILLYGTQAARSTREVSGQRPYTLVLGNAAQVRLEHDGRAVDLVRVTRQGVARLTIK